MKLFPLFVKRDSYWQRFIYVIRGIFVVALTGITIFSLLPVSYLPVQTFNIGDKVQHVGAYALLACTGLLGFGECRLAVLCLLLLHGLLIEVTQHLLGWRQGDVLDWIADGLGVLVGYLFFRSLCAGSKR